MSGKYGLGRQDSYRHMQNPTLLDIQNEVKGQNMEQQSGVTEMFMKAYNPSNESSIICIQAFH